jgi:hypothetical protein
LFLGEFIELVNDSSENSAPASSRAGGAARPAREDAGAPPDFNCFGASQRHMKAPQAITNIK